MYRCHSVLSLLHFDRDSETAFHNDTSEGGEPMASESEYTAAANAVRAGNASPAQLALNNKAASQSRFMNTLAQQAQDAQKAAPKR